MIGTSYHVGAAALVRTVKNQGRGGDLRFALSVDMVGRGKRFYLRSPQPSGPRRRSRARSSPPPAAPDVTVRWARDSGDGNSDHREFELAGLPAAVIEVWRGEDACHHEGCDRPGAAAEGRGTSAIQRHRSSSWFAGRVARFPAHGNQASSRGRRSQRSPQAPRWQSRAALPPAAIGRSRPPPPQRPSRSARTTTSSPR